MYQFIQNKILYYFTVSTVNELKDFNAMVGTTGKYKNKILYLYRGLEYFYTVDNGDIYYRSKSGLILSNEQKENSLFFGSLLECKTYLILVKWIADFKRLNPDIPIQLNRQCPIVLIPSSDLFREYQHKVDFAITVRWQGLESNTVYLIESKGIITKDSMMILRLIELRYKGISNNRYLMVFSSYPDRYPRDFPKELIKVLTLNLYSTLSKYIEPNHNLKK